MTAPDTLNYLDPLFAFLAPEKVDALAKETGFIQRKRKLTASDFLSLLFQAHGNFIDPSLQELSTKLLADQEIDISRTAVDKKFTKQAVHFLQRLVEELFQIQQSLELVKHPVAVDWPFTSLRILDATHLEVPNSLKAHAKKTRQSSVKIQHEFDVLTGRLTFLRIDFGNVNDTIMGGKRVPFLDEQELCLQDLGYFHFHSFEQIDENRNYFLTKFRNDAYLAYQNPFPAYHPDGSVVKSSEYQRIELERLCENMAPGEILELEQVYFGRDAHFSARCVLFARSEEQRQHRLQKIQRRASKSGKKPKQLVRDLAGITGYMTNLPEPVSGSHLVELYRMRWQIELNFKALKSYLEIDHFRLVKQERWLCHIYATLLVFLLSQLIAYQIRNAIWRVEEKEISETIAIRSIACEFLAQMYEAVKQKKKTLLAFVPLISHLFSRTARKPNSAKGTAMKRLQFI
ncbi:MAG: IS4 family transposase [Planococcus donghaensis]